MHDHTAREIEKEIVPFQNIMSFIIHFHKNNIVFDSWGLRGLQLEYNDQYQLLFEITEILFKFQAIQRTVT